MPQIDGSNLQIPSIYGQMIQRPAEMAQSWETLKQQQLNNRLLGQTVGGKEELGRIIGQHTGGDGEVNWSGVAAQAAKSPQASILLPEIQKAATERQQSMLNLDKSQLELSATRWGMAGDAATALLSERGPLSRDAVGANFRNNLVSSGMFNNRESQQQLMGFMESLPDDDAGIRARLKNLALQSKTTQERIGMILGTPQDVSLGNVVANKQVSPITGETRLNAALPMGLPPSTLAGTMDVIDPVTRETKKVTLGSQLGMPVGAPGNPLEGGSGVTTALAPGVAEAAEASGTQSAGVWEKDKAAAGGFAQRMQVLDKAEASMEDALTGRGGRPIQKLGAFLNTFGIKIPADVNSYAQAEKYLQEYANLRGADLGVGTDAGRALVNAANPSVDTPKEAAAAVLKVYKGLERMQASQIAAAQAEKIPPERYSEWRATWNRSVDPAAFAPPKLTKPEWEAKRKSMGDKWDAYAKGLQAALNAKVITPSDIRK